MSKKAKKTTGKKQSRRPTGKSRRRSGAALVLPAERLERRIMLMRGQKTMLDVDLARLYGVKTKALNQAVRRNAARFPADFMFTLTEKEKSQVMMEMEHLDGLRFSSSAPLAFTEQGVAMLASVLKSDRAITMSIELMRAFVRLRQFIAEHENLARRLDQLEKRFDDRLVGHDRHITNIFGALEKLVLEAADRKRSRIGFRGPDAVD